MDNADRSNHSGPRTHEAAVTTKTKDHSSSGTTTLSPLSPPLLGDLEYEDTDSVEDEVLPGSELQAAIALSLQVRHFL